MRCTTAWIQLAMPSSSWSWTMRCAACHSPAMARSTAATSLGASFEVMREDSAASVGPPQELVDDRDLARDVLGQELAALEQQLAVDADQAQAHRRQVAEEEPQAAPPRLGAGDGGELDRAPRGRHHR